MALSSSRDSLAKREFPINAPVQRVWDVIARAIYQSLPLEKMEIVDENNFRAELVWHLAFIRPRLRLEGIFSDVLPPAFLSCVLSARLGPVKSDIKVTVTLKALNDSTTQVTCVAAEEGRQGVGTWILRGQEQTFAAKTFESMRSQLERLCC